MLPVHALNYSGNADAALRLPTDARFAMLAHGVEDADGRNGRLSIQLSLGGQNPALIVEGDHKRC